MTLRFGSFWAVWGRKDGRDLMGQLLGAVIFPSRIFRHRINEVQRAAARILLVIDSSVAARCPVGHQKGSSGVGMDRQANILVTPQAVIGLHHSVAAASRIPAATTSLASAQRSSVSQRPRGGLMKRAVWHRNSVRLEMFEHSHCNARRQRDNLFATHWTIAVHAAKHAARCPSSVASVTRN